VISPDGIWKKGGRKSPFFVIFTFKEHISMRDFLDKKTTHKYLMEDYLEEFRRKHSLSEEDCGHYRESDMRFDILSDMPEDALRQWDAYVA
jgi:hypothetical protein